MKRNLSVLKLYVLGAFPNALGWMLGVGLAQIFFFATRGLGCVNLETACSRGIRLHCCALGIILVAWNLARAFCDRGGKMGNTWHRLGISEKRCFWLNTLSNFLILSLGFLLQGLLFLVFCFWFDPGVSGLEILATAYDHPLFHQFFPLDDLLLHVTNFILILGLSIACAAYPMRQRHGKHSITSFLMVLAAVFYLFVQNEGSHLDMGYSFLMICVSLYCIGICLAGTMTLEVDDND